jgi:hypothetical protein
MSPFSFIHEKGFIRGHTLKKDRQPNGSKREGSSEAIKRRRTDNPMDKEKVVMRGHKEKKDRQPNGQKRKGSNPFSFVRWVLGLSSLYGI